MNRHIRTTVLASLCLVALPGFFSHLEKTAARAGNDTPGEPIVLKSEDLKWINRSSGVKMAILQGDPNAPGAFTIRLRYPAGYRKGPHFHPREAYVTVLSGGYYRGYGSNFDESKGIELTPGTFSVNPARVSHYEWTLEPAMIQVTAFGPWETVYVDEEGRPVRQ